MGILRGAREWARSVGQRGRPAAVRKFSDRRRGATGALRGWRERRCGVPVEGRATATRGRRSVAGQWRRGAPVGVGATATWGAGRCRGNGDGVALGWPSPGAEGGAVVRSARSRLAPLLQ
ncbi:hypothetical protein GLE_0234 [Lysobacter enzymogenes]|uniref:Uncharacterized protein n=1 Tax=Lysobacter enzymogenes TaxID=69 RepID=A0A0S2DAN8_LYSEN|nr:hypothetical protein GLE_0234 [Lysobacter enzymogenes]